MGGCMVHKRSEEHLKRRRLRGTDLGFIDAGADTIAIQVPRNMVWRVRSMLQSLKLHDHHNRLAGSPAHYARDAARHAGLPDAELQGALQAHRAANVAKHQWRKPAAHVHVLCLEGALFHPGPAPGCWPGADGGTWHGDDCTGGCSSDGSCSSSSSSSAPCLGVMPSAWCLREHGAICPRRDLPEPQSAVALPEVHPPAAADDVPEPHALDEFLDRVLHAVPTRPRRGKGYDPPPTMVEVEKEEKRVPSPTAAAIPEAPVSLEAADKVKQDKLKFP